MNKFIIAFLVLIMMLTSYDAVSAQQKDMLVRIFGIEIVPEYLDEYQNHLERRISSFGDIGVGRARYFPAA